MGDVKAHVEEDVVCTELLSIYNWVRIDATTMLVEGAEKVVNGDRDSRERKREENILGGGL